MCAVSPVVHTSNIASCQKNFFSFPVAVKNSIKVGSIMLITLLVLQMKVCLNLYRNVAFCFQSQHEANIF